ncbi:hypothetical protein J3L16_05080 [Alteromonas sp. 5E99-2]|uniref:sulfurtransferase n=1 Tax=Alteromonas sp. 5E99-2 TaxID=2817683 RepID=UPI001A9A1E71|nr:rhodanese-like domain-containing protein [Alteromonas sp. 5E99-2]MBO1255062.1 hypothetical protein [Alteromonas sp. 5E99-2]
MTTIIETRFTRPGSTNKPRLTEITPNLIVDIDEEGKTCFTTEELQEQCSRWEVSPNQGLVITEAGGTFCAPRLAWILMNSGFLNVSVIKPEQLNGIEIDKQEFDKSLLSGLSAAGFVGKDEVVEASNKAQQIIDVRGAARFSGDEADPRPGVRAGHIPHSTNMPYKVFLSDNDGEVFLPVESLRVVFYDAGIDLDKPIIFSCGSGITACIGALAARLCGAKDVVVYDGSWADWGSDVTLPCATGHD